MAFEDKYRRLSEKFAHLEILLLCIMFVSSAYMLWGTFNFDSLSAARFPRLTAGTVFIGSALLLFRGYLPDRIAAALTEESEVFEMDEDLVDQEVDQSSTDQTAESSEMTEISIVGRPIHDSLFTAIAIVGYGLLGFIIGIFLATPIFVFIYARWFKLSWRLTIVLTVLGVAIAYAFITIVGVPIDRGEILFPTGVLSISIVPFTGVP